MANAINLVVGVPAIGLTALCKNLTAVSLTAGSPVVPAIPLSPLVASNLAVGSPEFTAQPITQVHVLTPGSLAVGSPVLGNPGYYMQATALVVSSPVMGTIPPTMQPAAIIAAIEASDVAAFVGDVPWIASFAATEGADVAALNGLVGKIGVLAATDDTDIVRIDGHIEDVPEYWYIYYPDDINIIFGQEIDEYRRVLLIERQVEFLEDGVILGRKPLVELSRDDVELLYEMSGCNLTIPNFGDLSAVEEASDTAALIGIAAFALEPVGITVASPILAIPTAIEVLTLQTYNFVTASPVIGKPIFGSLYARGFTVASPVFGSTQFASLYPNGFVVGHPSFTKPLMTTVLPAPVGFATGSPVLGAADFFDLHVVSITVGAPVLGTPLLSKTMPVVGLTVVRPTIGIPLFTSLHARGFSVNSPTFSAASLYTMSAMKLTVGSPQFTKPLLLNLRAVNLTIGPPDIPIIPSYDQRTGFWESPPPPPPPPPPIDPGQ